MSGTRSVQILQAANVFCALLYLFDYQKWLESSQIEVCEVTAEISAVYYHFEY